MPCTSRPMPQPARGNTAQCRPLDSDSDTSSRLTSTYTVAWMNQPSLAPARRRARFSMGSFDRG